MTPAAAGTADLTLDELRLVLAPAVAESAVFDGWTEAAVTNAALLEGVEPAVARLAFAGGAVDMVAAWIEQVDASMAAAFPSETMAALPIRERIRRLVRFRLEALVGREEALRRALVILAMPQNVGEGLRLGWASVDAMWRLAGDTATDYNHYTKRLSLGAIYSATLTVFADDRSEGHADAYAFLDRRIDDVMRFEKAKARVLRPRDDTFSVTRLLGRLRYPSR